MTNINNKGNWEFSFFQKTYDDKNQSIQNKEATIKVALRSDNMFNPKNIKDYINPELSKEEQIIMKNKNKETLKTQEKIIMTNYLAKQHLMVENDKDMIEKYGLVAKVETKEGKIRLLLHTLEYQIKNNNNDFIANIFLRLLEDQFKLSNELKREYQHLLQRMNQIVSKLNLVELQFTKFHTQIPPLNQKGFTKLDDWQINVIDNIDNNISTIISAPTSAGKSIISGYVTIKGKSLFIVPTDALAWQLSAYIGNILGTNVPILTATYQTCPTRDMMIDIINKSESLIGTADVIVDFLPFIKNNFKWIIFDEVHMIGHVEGYHMEYIAKILTNTNTSILALSATIGNINELVEWFNMITNTKFSKIECNKRFFNLQRYNYNNKRLDMIHPLALIDKEDFNSVENTDSHPLLDKNLEPTPPDIWDLVCKLESNFNLGELSPSKYFQQTERIHLDKVNNYFKQLLKFMINKYNINKDIINGILDNFKVKYNDSTFKYSELFFTLKKESKLPAIVFQEDTTDCLNIVRNFANEIDNMEHVKYPRLLIERMKICKLAKKQDKVTDKDKLDTSMEKKSLKQMITKPQTTAIDAPNLDEPHPDFIFNVVQHFSDNTVEEWLVTLKQYFPMINNSHHYIIKLLWRGVGVYARGLPDPYLRLVQTLASQKLLAIVFSDRSLVFGISMPFRSVVISKYNKNELDTMLYHQMAGRAGRRGLDKEGNIIFAGYTWDQIKKLSSSTIPSIKGINCELYSISHANKISELMKTNYDWDKVTRNYLDKTVTKDNDYFYKDLESNYKHGWKFAISDDINYCHMMWKLRNNKDCIVLSYLFPYIKRYFETKKYTEENNQIEIAHFLCRFICVQETNNPELFLNNPELMKYEPYNNIIDNLDELQIDTSTNIDKRLFLSIRHNLLYEKDTKLREQLFNFGNVIKHVQHYYFHTKIVGLAKLLGKLLTRIWWIYHLSSPILQ